jgi:RNA polymerase sigma-70 factor (sigma-E family)
VEPVTAARAEFITFVDGRRDRLLRIAVLLTGDVRDGEDLLQSVLEKVYLRWTGGHPPDNPDAYVRTALVNAARSVRRRVRAFPELLTAAPPETAADSSPVDVLLRARLLVALRRLPVRQRAVVAVRYFDDYSEHDVARILGCQVGTVKSHAHRGLKQLRADPLLAEYIETMREA